MKTHTVAEQQRAIEAIRKQQLYVPAEYANLLTGFPAAETLIRSLYPSANFSREHGTPFNYANITDVPSYSWSYASVLASAGIHILLSGCNNFRAPVLEQGQLNRNSPFWWQGPDGQKVLFWYSRMYQHMQMLFGLPPDMNAAYYTLPIFMQQYEHANYHGDAVVMYGTQVENTDLFPQQATFAGEWNRSYAYPRLQYSGFYDAMKNVAQRFGNDIPVVRGDGGPYWEDGIGSDALYAAIERNAEARGLSAEKLATLTSLINPKLAPNKDRLDHMWTNMLLMDEHTWDSYNSVSEPASQEAVQQLKIKDSYAVKAAAQADFLTRDSMATLANSISAGQNSLIVFNALNWSRTGLVSLDLNHDQEIFDPSTGTVIPYEVLGNHGSFLHVRFVAQNIPAVGYKVFQIRHEDSAPPPAATSHTTVLESPYYRVTLDPESGAVLSIYDKQLQRELVNRQSPYRFGQYLYVTGGDHGPNKILAFSHVHPDAKLQVHASHSGKLISVERTPYGWVARMKSTDTNTPEITTEIQLFDHEKKIEFVEDVDKKEVTTKEGVYFAFPFAMQQPQFQYEIQTGVVDPAKDMYPGAGHEWFSVQHWVSAQQNGVSATVMPLDAPLVTLGDINRGQWPSQFGQRTGTIFSYVMNNYWNTNYRAAQGGHFRFRYVITSTTSTNAAALSRMGWEEMTPLEHDQITSQDKAQDVPGPLSGKQDSFLQVSDSNVLLDTWKAAEDGNGIVLRFLDLGDTTRTVTVRSPLLHVQQVWQTDAVERNQKPLPHAGINGFQFTMHPHEIVTVKIFSQTKKNK
ncbi:MAG TPA: glycoside hydrolase family 38 C-terminal domain-containing protein, partial [Edaphobacter sp.]|nr:glycoside hydrolase family 38 C-terminal domain-containing protein [Edaphobacter sp.]